jgi:DNA-binding NarL/FixJ family response regulator
MGCKKRLFIADPHKLVSEACQRLLEPEFDVIGIVTHGRALVQAALESKPDLVILKVSMPQLNGLDAAQQIKLRLPALKLLFTAAICDPRVIAEAFRRGAAGYALKKSGAGANCIDGLL